MTLHFINLLGFGFVLGFAHAFEADHMVAVTALTSEAKSVKHSSLLGVLWGVGHTTTLLAVGAVLLALKLVIPPSLMQFFEFLVGVMLVVVGVSVAYRALRSHAHEVSDAPHPHRHRRSFFIGMVHGLAGTGAIMLLAVASVSSFMGGLFFILIFGVGSILGMLVMSTAISLPFHFISLRFVHAEKVIPALAGALSILLGLLIIGRYVFAR